MTRVYKTQVYVLDALLDGSLLDGEVENFTDVIDEATELHREYVLQRERLWVHVKLDVSLLHQPAPVTVAHRVMFEVHQQRQ